MKDRWVLDIHGDRVPVIIADAETYFLDAGAKPAEKYSLKTMSTTEYVRDTRFKAHGFSVVEPNNNSFWVSHDDLHKWFDSVDWSRTAMLAHNTYFDGLIASEHYGTIPYLYLDTMSMSYGEWGPGRRASLEACSRRIGREGKIKNILGKTDGVRDLPPELEEELGRYAIQDSVECGAVFDEVYYERGFPDSEVQVIDLSIRAFCRPLIKVDPALCRQEIEEEDERLKKLFTSTILTDGAGVPYEMDAETRKKFEDGGLSSLLNSNPEFAKLIRSRGVEPPMKPSPTYPDDPDKAVYAFAKNDLEFQALEQDHRVSDLVLARLGSKSSIRKTRAERLLLHSHNGTKLLPSPIRYGAARTMRWGGFDKINLQNLPSGRDGRGMLLRQSLMAPIGWRFVVGDSSQIECRTNATVANERSLMELFYRGEDPYSALASSLYGLVVNKYNEHAGKRPTGKAMELGLGYGMAQRRFYYSGRSGAIGEPIDITWEEAAKAITIYKEKRKLIVENWRQQQEHLQRMVSLREGESFEWGPMEFFKDKVRMPNGLFIHYRGLQWALQDGDDRAGLVYWHNNGMVRIWGSKFVENQIQCLSRIMVSDAALRVAKEDIPIVLLVHDEIDALAREYEADDVLAFILEQLKVKPDWLPDIPLDAEGGHSDRFDIK